ncbi:MAG: DUF4176 domain-containing protein [Lachnospiraceae bacterium]|nr:DUF4176 domain-containing protein [Lachnospiraceae bacterium]MBR6158384.1 DUF4176 domain-containing protein [Lachnospiraceae bacterium]
MKYQDLLPCGSIVKLKDGERYMMICGRVVAADGSDRIFDYVGCLYPEGMSMPDNMYFFDRDAIERILFIGFQDEEELAFREEVLEQLGDLKIENGEIVDA